MTRPRRRSDAGPVNRWHDSSAARSSVRSDLVRPNRARLASACFADCSRSLRFLNRFRLTTSPMLAPSCNQLVACGASRRRDWRCWAFEHSPAGEIRLASEKYSRSLIPRVSRSQNHCSAFAKYAPAELGRHSNDIPTLKQHQKLLTVLQTRNNLCSSTGLRS